MSQMVTDAQCKNCDQAIIFQPYFLDGKDPNPPMWWHPLTGTRTCDRLPLNWAKSNAVDWPVAEPAAPPALQDVADSADPRPQG